MVGEVLAHTPAAPIDREVQTALPLLDNCFRTAARQARARLVTRTGRDLPVTLEDLRSAPATDVLESDIADGAVWCPFHLGRADLAGFVLIEARLLSRLVGRLFGSAGDGDVSNAAERCPSEVELSVGARLCREFFTSLERLWPPPHPPRFYPGEVSPSRHGLADIPGSAPMVVAELRFGSAESPTGTLIFALPGALVRGMAARKAPVASRPDASRVLNYERLMPVEVDMVVELARIELSLQFLEGLKAGDDVPLGVVNEVCARVNDRASFFGEAGSSGGVRSFKIGRRAADASTGAANDR